MSSTTVACPSCFGVKARHEPFLHLLDFLDGICPTEMTEQDPDELRDCG